MKKKDTMIEKTERIYIFDFDDTLVNNHLVDFKSFDIILKKYGLQSITEKQLLKFRKDGMVSQDIFSKITSQKDVTSLVAERKKLLSDLKIWENLKLNKGVIKTLETIKKRKELQIIISRKSSSTIKKLLPGLKIDKYIDKIYTEKRKDILISTIINKYPGHEIIFVSDSEEDIIPIKALGVKSVKIFCFYNEYKNLERMRKLAKVITSLDEILN